MTTTPVPSESALLANAQAGQPAAFDQLTRRYRRELRAHCYRMLGSPHDADDALQEAMVAAWKGLRSFEGRSALRTWLYQVTTHACLRLASQRPKRVLMEDHAPPRADTADLGQMIAEPIWVEPWPDEDAWGDNADGSEPAALCEQRETVALAFIAALQHLPGTQRATLILRDVLEYSAAEVAEMLDTSVAAVNSALQRAHKTLKALPSHASGSQQPAGDDGVRELLQQFLVAWESRNVGDLVRLLAVDARFTMPPLPGWFSGRDDVVRFFAERIFATPWRLIPLRANGQHGFACYMQAQGDDLFRLGAINLVSVRGGQVSAISAFLDPALHRCFRLATELPPT